MTASDNNLGKGIGGKIWNLFGSLKFTLFTLFSLAIVSIIGTVIQQNQPQEFYVREYGTWASLILRLGLEDMYHAPWFTVLLICLIINIIVCTIDRFPQKWKATLEGRVDVDVKFIKNLLNNHTLIINEEPQSARERVINILSKRRYRIKESNHAEGLSIYAHKGMIGRFGSDVTHISLLLILLGAIIGSIFGFKDFGAFYEGEVTTIPITDWRINIDRSFYGIPLPLIDRQKIPSDIQLKLDKFWIDYYETGQTKQYNSILTLSDGGREVIKGKQIWVNAPLHYKGITFYQSSYGIAYDRVREASFSLKDSKTQKTVVEPFMVNWNMPFHIPNINYDIKVVGFVSDFAFDATTKTIYAKSTEHNNPAIQVEIYKNGKPISRTWLFYNYADYRTIIPDTNYELVFNGYKGIVYTGLSINSDPATSIVWIGSSLMVVGFLMAFFVFHKRIWVLIRRNSSETAVHFGGMINKNKFTFEKEFLEIVDSMRDIKK
ncbi:MAG: hypothetical protein A2X87_00815 [Deltaproteobacteria bacterium GWC2_42_51]|nr:MAG: hypothetical protein A2X87_00815 [Deltaproteobacteria bacterium GWC2_42_51]OGP42243.1 MAG: hypothetical protein A2090_03330 [Deltaproteobacteria bacterium GWD2_42_10]OGP46173.1 MAG: hypothetical protein A2022_01275 [Deltaproteobacteria bacterium GWF2_42_12]OGQ24474.1 MAG: hypothetical protein A3D29_01340 [Deltaproteobacteria bacterium RIFCSPHIGHO2_02_FULL_42_44]OGQ36447.1 MAG: hypothetical protein A3H47_06625 [Deltaproteobacteria bacterium RIFCSPLOWO2_02_FULL_42_39]OGQ66590.1 MAG: hypo